MDNMQKNISTLLACAFLSLSSACGGDGDSGGSVGDGPGCYYANIGKCTVYEEELPCIGETRACPAENVQGTCEVEDDMGFGGFQAFYYYEEDGSDFDNFGNDAAEECAEDGGKYTPKEE
jgi:hypothetical protein